MKHEEYALQRRVCQYLDLKYPDVRYLSDTVANVKLTEMQAKRNKDIQDEDFSVMDLIILEPNKNFHGLCIELKTSSPFKKDGTLYKQKVSVYKTIGGRRVKVSEYDHLEEQQKSINDLNRKGYHACFSWSFDMTVNIIDNYLKNRHI